MTLVQRIRDCRICEKDLPLGPRPIIKLHPDAKILIAGQAPGSRVHKTGVPFDDPSGDLPPLKICATTWRQEAIDYLKNVQLTLVIGQYAQAWHLDATKKNLTDTVRAWKDYGESVLPLPHPSPRNNIWLAKNRWFEKELIPVLRTRIRKLI